MITCDAVAWLPAVDRLPAEPRVGREPKLLRLPPDSGESVEASSGCEDILDPRSICWDRIHADVSRRLETHMKGVPLLKEEDAFLLYLILLALYEEGVRPSFSEIHYKLKEHHCSLEVEKYFLQYYLAQPEWYRLKIGSTELACDANGALLLQNHTGSSSRRSASTTSNLPISDTVVLFVREPTCFEGWVNLRDNANHYPTSIWRELVEFLHDCTTDNKLHSHVVSGLIFKHTRYALAKSLKELGPPSIRRMRLGEIAHIVQLAVQQNILCYDANVIQPTWTSFTMVSMRAYGLNLEERPKDSQDLKLVLQALRQNYPPNGRLQLVGTTYSKRDAGDDDGVSTTVSGNGCSQPTQKSASGQITEITDLNTLKDALRSLLASQSGGRILLSQLRVILQSKLHLSLHPLHFGYPKLSNLLLDKCSDICRLVRHRSRHVYVELLEAEIDETTDVSRLGLEFLSPNSKPGSFPTSTYGSRMGLTRALQTKTWLETVVTYFHVSELTPINLFSRCALNGIAFSMGSKLSDDEWTTEPQVRDWNPKDLEAIASKISSRKGCEVLDNPEHRGRCVFVQIDQHKFFPP